MGRPNPSATRRRAKGLEYKTGDMVVRYEVCKDFIFDAQMFSGKEDSFRAWN